MHLRDDVVALYVDPKGPYPGLVKKWYDEKRDARTYDGPLPVVAHPPCGPWGGLRHLSKYDDPNLAIRAVEQVRKFGGVLEHPKGSKLWEACGLPKPGMPPDSFMGETIEVSQCNWGHVARKMTWIYMVGVCEIGQLPPTREPTHWCSGSYTPGTRGCVPPGVNVASKEQRKRSPVAFAQWLIELASQAPTTLAWARK